MLEARVRPDILYAWKGPSLLIVNTRGECDRELGLTGFYHREARFLCGLRLEVNGHRPWLCEAVAGAPDVLEFTFVHPDVTSPGGGGTGHSDDTEHTDADGLPERALDIRVRDTVGLNRLEIHLAVTNRAMRALTFDLTWTLDADFADIQEAQGGRREQEAPVHVAAGAPRLEFTYGHSELPYRSSIEPIGGEWTVTERRLATRVRLDSQESFVTILNVVPSGTSVVLSEDDVREREAALEDWRERFTRFEAPANRLVEETVATNIRDFGSFPMLDGPRDEWLAPQAGMPLYPAFFGRDALTAGWQAGVVDCGQLLDASLTCLERLQSNRVDDWRDEEPGRVPYQVRQGPLALLNLNPYSAYYADYASPLMFVISLANLFAWTGEMQYVDRHWDTARRILDWAREYGDSDGDGYLEYQTQSSKGTKNQGWKDSGDAIIYPDGSPVPSPIATCELQGYWYIAQELMAVLSWVRGAREDAAEYRRRCVALKERFNRDWWVKEDNFFAVALDPDKRPVAGATSNVGHCVACGIVDDEHLPRVVGRLFAPDMFSGWGIRTLTADHAFYNPLSYHRGTVWAVEQATIMFGLRRFGFDARALDLASAMFDLAQLYPERRIPECIGGYARADGAAPGAYPRANTPQLWNATAFPLIVQTILGLLPLAPIETLVLDPVLPPWLPEAVLHELRVGNATVTLRFWREEDGSSRWEAVDRRGTLHIVRQPPPESLTVGLSDRLRALLR